jgi:hypothetical protein
LMEWDKILEYEPEVKKLARKWSNSVDSSLYEDACQHTMIKMREVVDLSKVQVSERKFVVGAINNILYKYFRSPTQGKFRYLSLEELFDLGLQVNEIGEPIWAEVLSEDE